jgi:hypothetical protein
MMTLAHADAGRLPRRIAFLFGLGLPVLGAPILFELASIGGPHYEGGAALIGLAIFLTYLPIWCVALLIADAWLVVWPPRSRSSAFWLGMIPNWIFMLIFYVVDTTNHEVLLHIIPR